MPEETTSNPDQANSQKVDQADPQKVPEDVAAEGSEVTPNPEAGESKTPSVAKEHAPSTDEPQATDLPTGSGTGTEPSADNPAVNPNAAAEKSGTSSATETASQSAAKADSESEEKTSKPPTKPDKKDKEAEEAETDKPAAKADSKSEDTEPKPAAKSKQAESTEESAEEDATEDKKKQKSAAKAAAAKKVQAGESEGKSAAKAGAKKPKKEAKPAVEDKPFTEFIQQDFLPTLEKDLAKKGIKDLQLTFENSQVTGRWHKNQRQFQFTVYFPEADIQGRKAFSWAEGGTTPSTLEPFLSDERKATLDLLAFYVLQRLNAQKWFGGN